MKIVAISMVKNEADIIEPFVRHTLHFADRLVVLDSGSSDDTPDILRLLQNEGLALDVIEDGAPGKFQSRQLTRLMRDYAAERHRADWVLPLDADEFVAPPPGAPLVPDGLAKDRPLGMRWRIFAPRPSDDPAETNPVVRIRHRFVERPAIQKVLVPGPIAARLDAVLPQGSHEIQVAGATLVSTPHPYVELAHFPVRDRRQMLTKIVLNSLQYRVMGAHRDNDKGPHYRASFERLKRSPSAYLNSLWDEAARYLENPPVSEQRETEPHELEEAPLAYQGGPLVHTPSVADTDTAWLALLHYADDLTLRFSVLAAANPRAAHDEAFAKQVDIVYALSQQLNRLQLDLGAKERCIQQQHRDVIRLHQELQAKEQCIQRQHRDLIDLQQQPAGER